MFSLTEAFKNKESMFSLTEAFKKYLYK